MPGFTCQWVSFPLRDITREQRRFFAEPPTLHFAPSSGFHSLSTVSSALELAGLFHPAATSRVLFRSGASLPPQPPFLIGRSLPPCRCCIAAPTHGPTFAGSPVSPRATPLDFEASICARPRSSGPVIHLARSRSPLRISCSSRFQLSRRRQPLSRSPSAHDVTRSMLRKNVHLSTSTSAEQLRGTQSPSSPGQVKEAVLVRYPCPCDHLAMIELGGRSLLSPAPFGASIRERSHETRRFVVSRPRASCDAGLLMPRCVSRASHTLAGARSSRVHPLRTLRCSEDCPTTVHRPQSDGHAPCSSCDAHVVLAFTVLAPAPALRRSRSQPLRGPVRRPPRAFARNGPRPSPSAFTTKSSWSRSPLSCLPCSPLDDHGQHSIGSQPTGSRIRVTFRREPATILFLLKIAPAPRTRPSRPPSPRGDDVCPAVGSALRTRLATFTSRNRQR